MPGVRARIRNTVAKILKQTFKPHHRARVSHLFTNRRYVAERTTALASMKFDFFLNLCFQSLMSERVDESTKHACVLSREL